MIIKLTNMVGEAAWVNADRIEWFKVSNKGDCTQIDFSNAFVAVKETPAEILLAIEDAKAGTLA